MMELDELKSAWNKMSSENEKKLQLNEGEIQNLLGKRTRDITEKIGRNIRIGMIIKTSLVENITKRKARRRHQPISMM